MEVPFPANHKYLLEIPRIMRDYEIKRGHYSKIDGQIEEIVRDIFGTAGNVEGKVRTSFGALIRLDCWSEGKTTLWVDTDMDARVSDQVAAETHRKYNHLLLRLTGYDAKQRMKRLKDKAKKGNL